MFRCLPIRQLLGKFQKCSNSYIQTCNFHQSKCLFGLEEFVEVKKANETNTNGRAWTPADLRKKVI